MSLDAISLRTRGLDNSATRSLPSNDVTGPAAPVAIDRYRALHVATVQSQYRATEGRAASEIDGRAVGIGERFGLADRAAWRRCRRAVAVVGASAGVEIALRAARACLPCSGRSLATAAQGLARVPVYSAS